MEILESLGQTNLDYMRQNRINITEKGRVRNDNSFISLFLTLHEVLFPLLICIMTNSQGEDVREKHILNIYRHFHSVT